MDYAQAHALVTESSDPIKHPYAKIQISYFNAIILPYDDAIEFLKLLRKAESSGDHRSRDGQITAFQLDKLEFNPMTQEQYVNGKIATLLATSVVDVERMQHNEQPQSTAELYEEQYSTQIS